MRSACRSLCLAAACLLPTACGEASSSSEDGAQDDAAVPFVDASTNDAADSGADDASSDSAESDAGADAPPDSAVDSSSMDAATDAPAEATDAPAEVTADAPDDAPADAPPEASADAATCGDGLVEDPEVCDDGNTKDGDYCSADCSATTGACGDGTLQNNEACDDGVTSDCTTTHDGGDGACVPIGACSPGYQLDGQGQCIGNSTGLTVPCENGPGWTLFRFHYDNSSTSARIDVWDATCSYSFAPGSACNVREVYPGFGDVDRTSEGYPIVTSSEYIRVRYTVTGLSFSQASLYVRARSYSTSASTELEAWSPLYGSAYGGPVDNDWTYDWYEVDWTDYLSPADDPALTAIQLYASSGSGQLAVRAMELCVQ